MGVQTQCRNAKLRSAKLAKTQFLYPDFSAAQLVGADLAAAVFFGCKFDGAHLYNANITGSDFMLSRPWMARLFFPPGEDSIVPVSVTMVYPPPRWLIHQGISPTPSPG